jgi:polypeptide N-acetylgalactosaminyltransferase
MSGGIMAVGKEYFIKIGGYDTEMQVFGGESLEFSFLVWICGGSIRVT